MTRATRSPFGLGKPGLGFACVTAVYVTARQSVPLGVITVNAKTFIVVFLSFWYLVVNDRGANPWLDFAGFYGVGNMRTMLGYAAFSAVAIVLAEGRHRIRLSAA